MCPKHPLPFLVANLADDRRQTASSRPRDDSFVAFFEHFRSIGNGLIVRKCDACVKATAHLVSAKTKCAKAAAENITEVRRVHQLVGSADFVQETMLFVET